MSKPRFIAGCRPHPSEPVAYFDLFGNLYDLEDCDRLARRIEVQVAAGHYKLVFDVSRLSGIGTHGIRLLDWTDRLVRSSNGNLTLVGVPEDLRARIIKKPWYLERLLNHVSFESVKDPSSGLHESVSAV